MTLALLDGDLITFRAAAAAQKSITWDDGDDPSVTTDAEGAGETAVQTVVAWQRLAKCKDVIVAFTGRTNFRKSILPTYKANRAGKVKPLAFTYAVNAVRERFPTELVEGLEADDILGVLGTRPKYAGAVITSGDKDLMSVPGRVLNPLKMSKPVTVTVQEADYRWLTQAITGDTSDGYRGIPKVGPKGAAAILGKPSDGVEAMWSRLVAAATARGMSLNAVLAEARVARILRDGEYDKKLRRVRLWGPEGSEAEYVEIEGKKI